MVYVVMAYVVMAFIVMAVATWYVVFGRIETDLSRYTCPRAYKYRAPINTARLQTLHAYHRKDDAAEPPATDPNQVRVRTCVRARACHN